VTQAPEKVIEVDPKTASKLFKRYSAPYVHGPFGPPTPPTVQQAIDKGALYSVLLADKEGVETPQVLIIANQLKSSSTHTAFDTTDLPIKAGELYASDIAKIPEAPDMDVLDMLDNIQVRANAAIWVEIYEEDALMRRLMLEGNFAYRGTKVNAYGDLTGMYYRPFPAVRAADSTVETWDAATLTCLESGFIRDAECDAILEELSNFATWWSAYSGQNVWADHYSTYNKNNTWSAFALRGYVPDDPTSIVKPNEMPRDWKKEHADMLGLQCQDTIALAHFPTVHDIMRRLGIFGYAAGFERVRLMRLTSNGGELTRHSDITDRTAGTRDGFVSRLHIPLRTAEQVQFQMWDHRGRRFQRHLSARDLWYLDQRKPHAAVNAGSVERVHLVIDIVSHEPFREFLTEAHIREIETNTHGLQEDPLAA
jgi:hypothetical protein